jgi:hypothetical protein
MGYHRRLPLLSRPPTLPNVPTTTKALPAVPSSQGPSLEILEPLAFFASAPTILRLAIQILHL